MKTFVRMGSAAHLLLLATSLVGAAACASSEPAAPVASIPTAPRAVDRYCGVLALPWSRNSSLPADAAFPCFQEIASDVFARREVRAVLRYEAGRLRHMRRESPSGELVEDSDGCAEWEVRSESDGASAIVCLGLAGVLRYTLRITEGGRRIDAFDAAGAPRFGATSDIHTFVRRLDKLGRISSLSFLRADGTSAIDEAGVHEYRYEHSDDRRTLTRSAWDALGNPVKALGGCFRERWTMSALGDRLREEGFDAAGRPMTNSGVTHITDFARDEAGNLLRASYFGTDARPIANLCGYAVRAEQHDASGYVTEIRYLDQGGSLVKSCRRIAVERMTPDAKKRTEKRLYFDESERPTKTFYGAFGYAYTYDSYGRERRRTSLDALGAPRNTSRGFATVETSYGDAGEVVDRVFYDASGASVAVFIYRTIFVTYAGSTSWIRVERTREEAMARISAAQNALKAGERLEHLVQRYSDHDGWLGPTTLERLPAEIARATGELEVDQITDVLDLSDGFMLIQRLPSSAVLPPE